MRKFTDTLYKFGENSIKYLFMVFAGILAVGAVVITESSNNMLEQKMIFSVDRMYITVPLALAMAAACAGVSCLVKRYSKRTLAIITGVVCVWYFAIGLILILRARSAPAADAMTVYTMAEMVSRGDLSIVHPTDSYLSYYPQQIGLTTFLAGILWVLNKFTLPIAEYHFVKLVYLAMICAATVAQGNIVRRLWKNDSATAVFLMLSALNLPYIVYATFIYNEIPSYCFFSVGACLLTELFVGTSENRGEDNKGIGNKGKENKGIKNLVLALLSIVCFALAVLLRKNILVLIIAVVITVIFQWIGRRKWEWLAYGIAVAVCSIMILPTVLSVYEKAAGSTVNSGVTAKSYFAMGMQESDGRGPGWYNGFNYDTFEQSGCDPVAADIISDAAIKERMDYFGKNPGKAVSFYSRKIATQWFDGTYASLQATWATMSDRSQFFNQVYEGKYNFAFVIYCEALQSLVYVGAFICALRMVVKKEKKCFWKYMFAIGVFGGFLFHILWEASSRYIVTYSLLLLPYSAMGIAAAIKKIGTGKSK